MVEDTSRKSFEKILAPAFSLACMSRNSDLCNLGFCIRDNGTVSAAKERQLSGELVKAIGLVAE